MRLRLPLSFGLMIAGLVTSPVWAATWTVYEGTIGKAPVVVELRPTATGVVGHYFYRRYLVDIPLEGTLNSLNEPGKFQSNGDRLSGATWEGKESPAGWSGEFHGGAPPSPIQLHKVATYVGPDEFTFDEETRIDDRSAPYLWRKFSGLNLETVGKSTVGSYPIRLVREKVTGVSYPRVVRHPRAAQVNSLLARRHWALIWGALDCLGQSYTVTEPVPWLDSRGDFDQVKSQIEHLGERTMSISEEGSVYCGGAHPNNFVSYANYRLDRGSSLDLLQLFRPENVEAAPDTVPRIRGALARLFKEAEATEKARRAGRPSDPEDDTWEGCLEYLPEYGQLSLNDSGLAYAVTGVGHAISVCNGTSVEVPLEQLRSLLTKEGVALLLGEE